MNEFIHPTLTKDPNWSLHVASIDKMRKLLSLEAKWERRQEGSLRYKDRGSFTGILWESPAVGGHSRPRNKAKRVKESGGRE